MTHDAEADAATTWLRCRNPFDESQRAIATWLLELSSGGGVFRQIGLDDEGSVQYRCGTQEYGAWNDEVAIEPYLPHERGVVLPSRRRRRGADHGANVRGGLG